MRLNHRFNQSNTSNMYIMFCILVSFSSPFCIFTTYRYIHSFFEIFEDHPVIRANIITPIIAPKIIIIITTTITTTLFTTLSHHLFKLIRDRDLSGIWPLYFLLTIMSVLWRMLLWTCSTHNNVAGTYANLLMLAACLTLWQLAVGCMDGDQHKDQRAIVPVLKHPPITHRCEGLVDWRKVVLLTLQIHYKKCIVELIERFCQGTPVSCPPTRGNGFSLQIK